MSPFEPPLSVPRVDPQPAAPIVQRLSAVSPPPGFLLDLDKAPDPPSIPTLNPERALEGERDRANADEAWAAYASHRPSSSRASSTRSGRLRYRR